MTETTLRVVPVGAERDAYLPLFSLADDSVDAVLAYYQTGTLFALDAPTGEPMGIVLALDQPDSAVELRAVAVVESLHGRGVATRMLHAVLDALPRRQAGGGRHKQFGDRPARLPATWSRNGTHLDRRTGSGRARPRRRDPIVVPRRHVATARPA